MSIKGKMRENRLVKTKWILFIGLSLVLLSFVILSIISIFQLLHPSSSAPWYTGIVVLFMIYLVPVLVIVIWYIVVMFKIKKQNKEE